MDFLKRFVSRWWLPATTTACTIVGMEMLPLPPWATAIAGCLCTALVKRK